MYACMQMYGCMHACMYVCNMIHIYREGVCDIYTYAYIHSIWSCACIYIYIYIYICGMIWRDRELMMNYDNFGEMLGCYN